MKSTTTSRSESFNPRTLFSKYFMTASSGTSPYIRIPCWMWRLLLKVITLFHRLQMSSFFLVCDTYSRIYKWYSDLSYTFNKAITQVSGFPNPSLYLKKARWEFKKYNGSCPRIHVAMCLKYHDLRNIIQMYFPVNHVSTIVSQGVWRGMQHNAHVLDHAYPT